jgi:RNA polymerase sigma factor (TIGR02999 family)
VRSKLAELLDQADQADPAAADMLFVMLYDELHRLAEHHLQRSGSSLTLSATTLVHEAYLNIVGRQAMVFPDRARFFAYASKAMRGLVIDYARRRRARKRGREFEITLTEDFEADCAAGEGENLEALGEALHELGELDPALAELVDMHFFGGFTLVDIAGLRGVSERTVQRDWQKARLLLHHSVRDRSS